MMIWLIVAALLAGFAAVVLLLTMQRDSVNPETEKRFNEVLETPQDEGWLNQRKWRKAHSLTNRFKRLLERTPGTDMAEVEMLMRQAALVDEGSKVMVYASLWATPLATTVLGVLFSAAQDANLLQSAFIGFVLGFIAPRKFLRMAAEQRKRQIREELPVVLNLMSLLSDAGLSLEHMLKAISEQGKNVTPHLSQEFGWALARVQHGQERGDALEEMARRIDIMELTEMVSILKQAARYGGSLRESLLRYLRLMEERRMTDLRDKVGQLSAKMTGVMVVFMFPALMIFLAGPGFSALVRALQGL